MISVLPVLYIRWQVLDMFKTSNGRHRINRCPVDERTTRALVCSLSGSCAACPVLMCSASCRYPVCIRSCPLDLSCERSTALENILGAPRGLGDLERMALYFQGAGDHWYLFSGIWGAS